jgi:hypothetical protein
LAEEDGNKKETGGWLTPTARQQLNFLKNDGYDPASEVGREMGLLARTMMMRTGGINTSFRRLSECCISIMVIAVAQAVPTSESLISSHLHQLPAKSRSPALARWLFLTTSLGATGRKPPVILVEVPEECRAAVKRAGPRVKPLVRIWGRR